MKARLRGLFFALQPGFSSFGGSSGGAGDGREETTALQRVFVGDLDSLSVIMADRQAGALILVGLILVAEVVVCTIGLTGIERKRKQVGLARTVQSDWVRPGLQVDFSGEGPCVSCREIDEN